MTRPVILFGGKGGVGKTTCSAAVAAASAFSGTRTIVITSDMTPSLSDIFETTIGDRVTRIDTNLDGFEISQDAIVGRWKKKFSRDFHDILSQLIDLEALDAESRHHLLDYIGSAPSLREETMLDLIVDLVDSGDYKRVIWDTAPSGETLNLLNMPQFIRRHLTAGAKVFEGLDKIGRQLTGKRSIAATMDEWIRLSERISQFVRDKAAFMIVSRPEALVVRHVDRLARTLRDYSVVLGGLVINGLLEGAERGALRDMQRAQTEQQDALVGIAAGLPVARLQLAGQGIRGIGALRKAGASLCVQLALDQ